MFLIFLAHHSISQLQKLQPDDRKRRKHILNEIRTVDIGMIVKVYCTLREIMKLICVKVFKNGPSKFCGRQPLENVT